MEYIRLKPWVNSRFFFFHTKRNEKKIVDMDFTPSHRIFLAQEICEKYMQRVGNRHEGI